MTSVREGWGLVVTEANALGTPAVVYDAPGLRDSTRDGETGLVCKENSPRALAQAIVALDAAPGMYARLRESAWGSAKSLSWDLTARAAWKAVETYL
jgi:glycosyltransferase involved in cell wall biosynthesis